MEFLIVVLGTLGAVWGLWYAFHGSLLAGCTALLIINYCFGHHFIHFDVGSLPLTLDRLVLAGLLAASAWQWAIGRLRPPTLTWMDGILILLVVVLLASTLSHSWQLDQPGKVSPLWLLVAGYLMPATLYGLVRGTPLTERNVKSVYGALALLGLYLAITGLAEVSQQWWAVYPTYIRNPKLGIHFGRARGPLLQSHCLGMYLCMCALCTWAWGRGLGRLGQLAVYASLGISAAALYFTYTRCIWMGAATGTLIVLALTVRAAWRPVLFMGVLGGLLVGVLGWQQVVGLKREAGEAAARDSVSQRAAFTYVSWKMFLDRPLWGVGFGQFPTAKLPYLSDRAGSLELEAIRDQPHHNTFLSLLTEVGLVGAVLYLVLLGGWGWTVWQQLRDPLAPPHVRIQAVVMLAALGIYINPALFFDLAYSPPDQWFLFFLGGISVSLSHWKSVSPAVVQAACPQAPAPSIRFVEWPAGGALTT